MKFEDIEARIGPVLDECPAKFRRQLRRFMLHPATFSLFTALENELYLHFAEGGATVLFSSCIRSEGRTTAALTFALLSAVVDPSRRILIVDADLNNGDLAGLLGIRDVSGGLSEIFDGAVDGGTGVRATKLANLSLMPRAGDSAGRVLLDPRRFQRFVEAVRREYDLVVFDSPAANSSPDVGAMARVVGTAVVVIRYGQPSREQVGALIDELARADTTVLGCVLNRREFVVPRFLYGA